MFQHNPIAESLMSILHLDYATTAFTREVININPHKDREMDIFVKK
jgi:hypothetical protein